MKKQKNQKGKPIYKKWWFWLIIVLVFFGIIGLFTGGDEEETQDSSNAVTTVAEKAEENSKKVVVVDFSKMKKAEVEEWAKNNGIKCEFEEKYSDTVAKGGFVSQSVAANTEVKANSKILIVYSLGKKPSVEYLNALSKAKAYSDTMHMSKKGIYEQLTSEYGEKFSADAAKYAIDNLEADYKLNALEKAKIYQKEMSMSKSAIYDQLISSYGEKFTKEEAQYAVDHLPN